MSTNKKTIQAILIMAIFAVLGTAGFLSYKILQPENIVD